MKHPDKEEIISKLTNGESVRNVEAWLKEKYPKNENLWVTSVTLQGFRKANLQLEGKVLKDIQEAGKLQKQKTEECVKLQQLEMSDAYKKKINEIADTKLDVARRILELDSLIEDRMEYWFNAIKSGDEKASTGDKELRLYMDRMMNLMTQYKKLVEGLADKTIDHNVNITIVNDQINIIRDVIRECMLEISPEQAMLFMDKMNKRMNELNYRPLDVAPLKLDDLQEAEIVPLEKVKDANGI